MITSILSFCLKSILCSAVFGAYYLLALRNARMHTFNRFYLLGATLLSLLLPFVEFEWATQMLSVPDFPLLPITGKGDAEMNEAVAVTNSVNWQAILTAGYFTVTGFMLLRLAIKSLRIFSLKTAAQQTKRDGFILAKTDDPHAPFSFFNTLFWPNGMSEKSPEGQRILRHELAHIRQYHTLDKMAMQLLLALCWPNPFNWIIQKELWLQHEFLADEAAIEDRDSETFVRMLFYAAVKLPGQSITSPFFQSPIKRRLLMLQRPARNAHGFLRRLFTIPVLLVAASLLSAHAQSPNAAPSPKKIVLVLDAAHGGADPGAKSVYGYVEKDLTLAICKKLFSLSKEYNTEVILTRMEDSYPTLEERIQKSNSSPADVFLSVHINQSSAVRDNTYQLGVNPKSQYHKKTLLLASAIGSKLKTQGLPVEVVDHSMAYVLRENRLPALLIECGNLDNPENMALLKDEARTETLCRNILSGIVAYEARQSATQSEMR